MVATLKDWFCLKPGRDNFKLKVTEDCQYIFCHEDQVQDEILRSIEMRFAANEPIKMLLYGDWGVGKTHTAHHIRWWLEKNADQYPAHTVMIEIGDIDKKSRFDVIVRPLLDSLGLEFLIELTHNYLTEKQDIVGALERVGVPHYVSTVIGKFAMAPPGMTPPQVVPDAFNILKGRKPPSGGTSMGLGDQLVESTDFYGVLLAIGEMHRTKYAKRVIFIADEAAKLDDVGNDDATLAHWVATNRLIFDDQNDTFGFIYTLSGKSKRQLPQALWHPQLQNRVGENAFELTTLGANDVEGYLHKLRNELIDKNCVSKRANAGDDEWRDYSWDRYPFTQPGWDHFVDHFKRNQEDAKPRDISDRLNAVGFVALKSDSPLINEEHLEKAQM